MTDELDLGLEKIVLNDETIKVGVKNKPKKGDVGAFYVFIGRNIDEVGLSFGETEWESDTPLDLVAINNFPEDFYVGHNKTSFSGESFHCWVPAVPNGAEPVTGGSYVMLQPNLVLINGVRQTLPAKLFRECAAKNNIEVVFRDSKSVDDRTIVEYVKSVTSKWPAAKNIQFANSVLANNSLNEFFEIYNQPDIGEVGKCVLYYDSENKKIGLAFRSATMCEFNIDYEAEGPDDARHELRGYMDSLHVHTDVGYHKSISIPSGARRLSGGAFYVEPDGAIFIDQESGDFGKMHKVLVDSCVRSAGIKPVYLDDRFFYTGDAVAYLSQRARVEDSPLLDYLGGLNEDVVPSVVEDDDDIPF